MSALTPWRSRFEHYVTLRSLALYAAAAVPLSTAIHAGCTRRTCDWYSLAVALSLVACGLALRLRRRWTGFVLLWVAMMLLLMFGFWELGPGVEVLSSVIVLVMFGGGVLALIGGARPGPGATGAAGPGVGRR